MEKLSVEELEELREKEFDERTEIDERIKNTISVIVAKMCKEKIIKMIPAGKPAGIFLSLKNSSYCMCTQKIPENPEMQKERN